MTAHEQKRRPSLLLRILLGGNPQRTLFRGLLLAFLCFLVFKFAVRPVMIDGESMEPTIADRSFHFINMLTYKTGRPQRGDIVAIDKDSFNTMFLKRVIATPGQTARFEGGTLHINGRPIPEPYLRDQGDWDMRAVALGPNEYLVAGDHRSVSREKHVMGVVKEKHILGKLIGW